MPKLTGFLLLCFAVLACNTKPNDNSTAIKTEQTSQNSLSSKERQDARTRFDSLMTLVNQFEKTKELDSILKYLHKSSTLAQLLNNDSLLAKVYLNLGLYADNMAEYNLEVEYNYKAFELFQKNNNYAGAALALNNMAWGYIQAYDYQKGIEQARLGLILAKNITNKEKKRRIAAFLYNNISIAYLENNLPDSALILNELSYASIPNLKKNSINHYAWIFAQFGNIYVYKKNYAEAEKNFNTVMEIKDSIDAADGTVYTISKYCRLLNNLSRYNQAISIGRDGIRIARKVGLKRYVIDIANELSYSYEKLNRIDSAYIFSKMAAQLRDSVFNTQKSIQLQNISFSRDLKAKELNFEIEKAKAQEKLKGAQRLKNIFLLGFVFVMLFAGLFLFQRNKIKAGKIRSDELLLNILPAEVAEELKSKGSTSAKQFENVTVMFTDFKNFTQIAEKLSPQELVSEIHTCFKAFDQIIEKYGIEKIKTIGDAYMCVGGLPVSNTTHALDVVSAALQIQQFIRHHSEQRQAEGKELFEIRIGIHTGPVVAGIVGIKKFAYDIWGDTVNIASRMESSSEVGKINISETTYELVKEQFNCTYRGKINVKNKGDLDMYFIS